MATDSRTANICGDEITIRWDGNVWVSPHNGQQHARAADAMRSEIRAYYLSCGEDVEEEAIAEEIEDHVSRMAEGK